MKKENSERRTERKRQEKKTEENWIYKCWRKEKCYSTFEKKL